MTRLSRFRWYRILSGGYWLRTRTAWLRVSPSDYFRQEIAPDPRVIAIEDNNGTSGDIYAGMALGISVACIILVAYSLRNGV